MEVIHLQAFFSPDGIFSRVMNFIWDLIWISILWLVCCIPIVTIGASSLSAYYTMAKVVRHKTGQVTQEFFGAFRRNFKQATILTLIFGVILAVLFVDCVYVYSVPEFPLWSLYLFYLLILVALADTLYIWPCLSRFDMKNLALCKMTTLLLFRHLLTTILLLLLLAATLIGIFLMPWGILIFPGLMFYLQTYLMERILLRYSPKPEEGDPEAEKWYYQ